MAKVFWNPGHGGTDPGAVSNGLKEKDLVLEIAKKADKYLKDNYEGVTTKMFRSGDQYYSLNRIASEANNWNADIFVSIHINAGGGTGFESYIYSNTSNRKTKSNQNTIHAEIMKNINVRNRGKKSANFAVLRQTKMPAILTENLFIDTKADADKLKQSSFIDELAKGHADGVAKALKLKKKSSPKPNVPKQSNIEKDTFYRVVTGSFSDRKNAEARIAALKKVGFDSFIDVYKK